MNLHTLFDALSWGLLSLGAVLLVIGGIGLLRFPDFYTRTHAGGITDTLATWCVILGLLFQAPQWIVAAKLVFILVFMFFTSPVSTHALVRSAFTTGLYPRLTGQKIDPRLFEGERAEADGGPKPNRRTGGGSSVS